MAEFALIASIIQVADVGFRLSLRLYSFGETVFSADRSISAVSSEVALTSSVLKELGHTLEGDKSRICSENAARTAKDAVRECSNVFQELDAVLLEKVPQLRSGRTNNTKLRATLLLERLRWPTIKRRIQLLRSSLDTMKSILTLMLNVIIYAKQVSERTETPAALLEQKLMIENLACASEDHKREFQLTRQRFESSQYGPEASNSLGPDVMQAVSFLEDDSENPEVGSSATSKASNAAGLGALKEVFAEYTRLRDSLVGEVTSPSYNITKSSRNRFKRMIVSVHNSEIALLHPTDISATPSLCPSLAGVQSLEVCEEIAEIECRPVSSRSSIHPERTLVDCSVSDSSLPDCPHTQYLHHMVEQQAPLSSHLSFGLRPSSVRRACGTSIEPNHDQAQTKPTTSQPARLDSSFCRRSVKCGVPKQKGWKKRLKSRSQFLLRSKLKSKDGANVESPIESSNERVGRACTMDAYESPKLLASANEYKVEDSGDCRRKLIEINDTSDDPDLREDQCHRLKCGNAFRSLSDSTISLSPPEPTIQDMALIDKYLADWTTLPMQVYQEYNALH